jgi:hypothetical protein
MSDRLVGIREAAQRLDLHPKRLQIMCREGTSPVRAAKRGDGPKAEWVFSDSEISRYIAGLFAGDRDVSSPTDRAVDAG